jgi:hypothetical protein
VFAHDNNGELNRRAWLAAVVTLLAGCSVTRAPATPASPACAIGAADHLPPDTLFLATLFPIDLAHAPDPTNAAERLVFVQLYETLIDVDCVGRAHPALARSWTLDATRTRVTLTLRDGARFWNGDPVDAAGVLAAWRATGARSTESSPLPRRVADATTIVDDRTLIVSLPDTNWIVLADAALAVYRPQSTAGWPIGSGRYRVAPRSERQSPSSLSLTPTGSPSDPVLVTRSVPGGDPRDAIDAAADVLITDDLAALSYAESRAELTTVSLPWTRTYALAIPRTGQNPAASLLTDADSALRRASLARDAVRTEARDAQPPFWWTESSACQSAALVPTPRAVAGRSNRIVYRRDDHVARGLAERLVALGRGATATGLPARDFDRALSAGTDLAYVLDLPHTPLSPCRALAALRVSAPWLETAERGEIRLVPLVDTRQRAVVHRRRVAATINHQGILVFGRVGP